MKKILVSFFTLFFILSGTVSMVANANTDSLPEISDVNGVSDIDLQKYFNENQIPAEKQDILREKVENNILWDAYNPEQTEQLPSDFYSLRILEGETSKRYNFEDGSFVSISISPTENSSQTFAYPDFSLKAGYEDAPYGTYFWDYKISKRVGAAYAEFYMDFLLTNPGNGYKSKIFNIFGQNATGFGIDGTPTPSIERPNEDLDKRRSALANIHWVSKSDLSLSWQGNGINTSVGTTCYLWVGLLQGMLYVDSSLPY